MAVQRLQFEHFEISTDQHGSPIRLGPGGMGTTFRAYDTRLRKFVALKIINDRLLADANSRRRFFNEARAAALIDHPNVARVLYLCPEEADECFFAMELVEGESLANRVARQGPLPAGEALLLLRSVADALTALGEHRLVHRDIKPDNIMIARAGRNAARVKLIDFGLAKALEHAPERFDSVHTGEHFVGTIYFASPEQIQADRALDCRSDFYSLGATLWHMLTGSPPFDSKSFGHVVADQINKEPPWGRIAHLPPPIHKLLHHLLTKDPGQRPPDAETLLGEWDKGIAGVETFKFSTTPPTSRPTTTPTPADSKPTTAQNTAPVVAVAVEQAPQGCAVPVPPGRLARDAVSGDWLVVRVVPKGFAPELRSEFFAAARAAAAARHGGLLNIREVRAAEVISEWTPGVAATQLLARQRGALALSVIRNWLPMIAETVDWAREQRIARISLTPARWLVSFEELTAEEKPIDRAGLAPDVWGAHTLRFDPLAGFDAELASATTSTGNTEISARQAPLLTPGDFLAAFASAIYELLGGRSSGRITPLPAINESANELLRNAIAGRSGFATAHELADAFLECGCEERVAPLRVQERHLPATDNPPAPIASREAVPSPPPQSVRSSFSQQHAITPHKPLALALVLLIAGLIGWWFGIEQPRQERQRREIAEADRQSSQQAKENLRKADEAEHARLAAEAEKHRITVKAAQDAQKVTDLLPEAKTALDGKDFALAREKYQEVLAVDASNAEAKAGLSSVKQAEDAEQARLAMDKQKNEEQRIRQEAETRKKVEIADRLAKASKELPYQNSLGMKFVPVPGTKALFSVWDTRVRDFLAYAEATDYRQRDGIGIMKVVRKKNGDYSTSWQADMNASWAEPGFSQSMDHPVVGVSWEDAKAFCAWLTQKEQTAGWISTEQEYRLPTDAEWSAAVGDDDYPWGNEWPPPEGAGNYFDDAAVATLPGKGWTRIPGNDRYARTSPVGSFRVNRLGLYDMGGNVWQWCEDWYRTDMNERTVLEQVPALKDDGGGQKYRVLRGGSWRSDSPADMRSSSRLNGTPGYRRGNYGFRCVIAAPETKNSAPPAPTGTLQKGELATNSGPTHDATTTEVRAFILAHEKREQDRDMDGIMSDFAPEVDYSTDGKVSREAIRKEKTDYFRLWPTSTYSLAGEMAVTSLGEGRFKVTFPTSFSVKNERGDWVRGESTVTYEVVATATGLQIASEKGAETHRDTGTGSAHDNSPAKVP